MTDQDFLDLAREDPDALARMIDGETERQGDMPMTDAQLRESQRWVARAEAARKRAGGQTPAQDGFHSPEDDR